AEGRAAGYHIESSALAERDQLGVLLRHDRFESRDPRETPGCEQHRTGRNTIGLLERADVIGAEALAEQSRQRRVDEPRRRLSPVPLPERGRPRGAAIAGGWRRG